MKKHELRIINALLTGSRGRPDPEGTLDEILEDLARRAGAAAAAIYLRRPADNFFRAVARFGFDAGASAAGAVPGDSPLGRLLEETTSPLRREGPAGGGEPWQDQPRLLLIPATGKGERWCLVMGGNGDGHLGDFGPTFMAALGTTLGLVMEERALATQNLRHLEELHLLHEIGRTAYATLEPDLLLPALIRQIVEILECAAGRVHLVLATEGGEPRTHSWPAPPEGLCSPAVIDEVTGMVLAKGTTVLDHPCGDRESAAAGLLVSVIPLRRREEVIGCTLLLHRRALGERWRSEPTGESFLESLAAELSIAVANAVNFAEARRLAEENDHRARELAVFFEISRALSGTRRLDDVLHVILAAATYGRGLGFNRATLFLLNEKTNILQGMMGVGPDSADEAARIWGDLAGRDLDLAAVLRTPPDSSAGSALDAAVKSVRIQVTPENGILARTVLERRAFNVTDSGDGRVNRQVAERLGAVHFATAPLVVDDAILGVLAVDNKFNGRPITEHDLERLVTFASQASLALRNAQLYNRLERSNQEMKGLYRRLGQSERLAALGELAATVAHEVRNPLVSIGGFARRLERRLDPHDPNRRYTGIILKELTRLEKFLGEILTFSRELPLSLGPVDLNALVAEVADLFFEELESRGIRLEFDLAPDLPSLRADADQLTQVLVNLLTNAIDAQPEGGVVAMTTRPPGDDGMVVLTFRDAGGGIPPEIMQRIFHPFFTTKAKGTGLGLPLIMKLIKNHSGAIDIDNRPGESVTFVVRLPLDPQHP